MKTFLFALAALLFSAVTAPAADVKKLSPADASQLVASGHAVLVDVREAAEWADTGVAAPATLLAKSDFDGPRKDWKPFLEKHRGETLILYCRSGHRAGIVADALAKEGFTVANAGSFAAWKSAGLPVRKP
jgi:rhodanese-related sulfurtransferase